ncbi:hypothetical protein [Hymenobacter crusticola]|uniref:Uncharacterized protein n=1 Tax=Hymenobacter crusticola TaxID=1770526 RepID=A0A243W581_9BACT|nr:hypothetical protein [Hymenobacter crusticola]OUJ68042.1 hypothetical protein BXP70_28130 [Hymenobacter crusticola]
MQNQSYRRDRRDEAVMEANRIFYLEYYKVDPAPDDLDANWGFRDINPWAFHTATLTKEEKQLFEEAWRKSEPKIEGSFFYTDNFGIHFIQHLLDCPLSQIESWLHYLCLEHRFGSRIDPQIRHAADCEYLIEFIIQELDKDLASKEQRRRLKKARKWLRELMQLKKNDEQIMCAARFVPFSDLGTAGFLSKFLNDLERLPWDKVTHVLDREYQLDAAWAKYLIEKVKDRLLLRAGNINLERVITWLTQRYAFASDTNKSVELYAVEVNGKITRKKFTPIHAERILSNPDTVWREIDTNLDGLLAGSNITHSKQDVLSTEKPKITQLESPQATKPANTLRTIYTALIGSEEERKQKEVKIKILIGPAYLNLHVVRDTAEWSCFIWALVHSGYLHHKTTLNTAKELLDNTFPEADLPARSTVGTYGSKDTSPSQRVKQIMNILKTIVA